MSNDVLHAPAGKTDGDIRNDVMSELSWDSRIGETQIGVQVDHGVVTLGGSVEDWATCRAAVEAAHRVAGVQDVANELQVRNSLTAHLTDTDIAKAVRHALEWDALVPEKDIRSTVADGVVVLEGVVATPIQREEAERLVGRLRGIKRLINRLQISRDRRSRSGRRLHPPGLEPTRDSGSVADRGARGAGARHGGGDRAVARRAAGHLGGDPRNARRADHRGPPGRRGGGWRPVIAPALVIVALATAAQTTTPATNTTTAAESPWTLREQLQIPAMTANHVVGGLGFGLALEKGPVGLEAQARILRSSSATAPVARPTRPASVFPPRPAVGER